MLAGGHALRRCQLDHLLGGEAVRAHDRFGTALLRAGRQPFERAAAVGLEAVATAAGLGHGVAAAVLVLP